MKAFTSCELAVELRLGEIRAGQLQDLVGLAQLADLLYQAIAIIVVLLTVLYLAHNTTTNMKLRGIQSGFDFLSNPCRVRHR